MSEPQGHLELERSVDSITIGVRSRRDLGDVDALAASIDKLGLLQPITITPGGVLVCGWRRLEAVRRLGWRTVRVWVRSGISDDLSRLLAQQDENARRKALNELEAAQLHRELTALMREDAARRQAATRFGGSPPNSRDGEDHGAAQWAGPERGHGDARRQAAEAITGRASYSRHERVAKLVSLAEDPTAPTEVRRLAREALADINAGAPVMPAFTRVEAARDGTDPPRSSPGGVSDPFTPPPSSNPTQEELARLSAEALARVRREARTGGRRSRRDSTAHAAYRSVRSFVLTWTELDGWTRLYDLDEVARTLTEEEWDRFQRVVAETTDFASRLRDTRGSLVSA